MSSSGVYSFLAHFRLVLTGHPRCYGKDTPFSRFPTTQEEHGRETERNKKDDEDRNKGREKASERPNETQSGKIESV